MSGLQKYLSFVDKKVSLAPKAIILDNVAKGTKQGEAVPYEQALKYDSDGSVSALSGKTVSGSITFSGVQTISNSTQSTSYSTGAVIIAGGVGIAKNLYVNGTVNGKLTVTNTGGAYATPIVLTEAQSGSLILVNDAAGLDFTLPAITSANVGVVFEFLVTVSVSSNNFRVTAGAGNFLVGALWIADFDTANTGSYFAANGSSHLVCTMNGSTKGGKVGTKLRFTAISATQWFVEGITFGDGVLATPFS